MATLLTIYVSRTPKKFAQTQFSSPYKNLYEATKQRLSVIFTKKGNETVHHFLIYYFYPRIIEVGKHKNRLQLEHC